MPNTMLLNYVQPDLVYKKITVQLEHSARCIVGCSLLFLLHEKKANTECAPTMGSSTILKERKTTVFYFWKGKRSQKSEMCLAFFYRKK